MNIIENLQLALLISFLVSTYFSKQKGKTKKRKKPWNVINLHQYHIKIQGAFSYVDLSQYPKSTKILEREDGKLN